MMELTEDPFVMITYREKDSVIYHDVKSGIKWIIWGDCNQCGECIVGAVYPDIRPRNKRKDIPVTPEISKHPSCSLRGMYID